VALTLIESAKLALDRGDYKTAAIQQMFARSSAWLGTLPFTDIPGNSITYRLESALPGSAFRAINEAYTESTGTFEERTDALRILGGDLDVDKALVKMLGGGIRSAHEQNKIKSMAAEATRVLIKGDSIAQPREPDGLQVRCVGTQLVANSAAAGGAALSLTNLDLAIQRTASPVEIWLHPTLFARFTAALRTTAVSGVILTGEDEFGRPAVRYNGLPLVTAYPENDGTEPIDFLEVPAGGAPAATTSLYVVGKGGSGLVGIQNGGMEVKDLGELNAQPVFRTRVEWLMGWMCANPRAVTRLYSITNAAIVA